MSTATKINCEIRLDMSELLRIEANLLPQAEKIVRQAALLVEGKAKSKVPVDTGALKNSIYASLYNQSGFGGMVMNIGKAGKYGQVRVRQLPMPDHPLIAYVGPTVEYGIYVEFGTYKMAAQPYLWPAVIEANPEFLRMFRQLVVR